MKIVEMIENEDGSARMEVEMTADEISMILEFGMVQLLKNAVERGELVKPDE